MNPETLLGHLSALPATYPLVFETDEGPIGGGYHVTEWKHAKVTSIDCGARVSSWVETTLQLLDGGRGDPMTVEKFSGILATSIKEVDGLGASQMQVEFAPGNKGMRLYHPAEPQLDETAVTVRLTEGRAQCKPATEAVSQGRAVDCCGSQPGAAACCG
ncbi:MAG: DUF6428 family protein [Pseudomonadota bacterium]